MLKRIFIISAIAVSALGTTSSQARADGDQPGKKALSGGVSLNAAIAQGKMVAALSQLDKFGMHCLAKKDAPMPAIVGEVTANSQAYRSGLKEGDIILASAKAKEDYALTIKRDGKLYSVTLRGSVGRHPFPELEIAELRHEGVMQHAGPNCWFEAGLSAVADSPDGPKMLSDMISAASYGYDVKFPGVEAAVPVTEEQLVNCRVADPAKWARVLECAEMQVFPDNAPAQGAFTSNPGVKVGLQMLTGRPVEFLRPDSMSDGELAALLIRLRQSGKPVTMASKGPGEHHQGIQPLTPNHVYSVVDFDAQSGLLTLRNPYGREGRNGMGIVMHVSRDQIKLDLPTVRTFFRYIAYPA